MTDTDILLDFGRPERIGLEEAIFCEGKSADQIAAILDQAAARAARLLLTRLSAEKLAALPSPHRTALDYCALSRTAFFGAPRAVVRKGDIAIVAAGASDAPVAREASRSLRYLGHEADLIVDVGVAGLWRLTERLDEIRRHPIVIVVAGMDAAIASVLGGLVGGAIIAVPTSVGYGAAEGGRTALNAMLASCAPGLLVCNIDNGYGAASAALRVLNATERLRESAEGSG
jgi:pyridinium-3,5-biscarboxylic acid mononucleotide synthase